MAKSYRLVAWTDNGQVRMLPSEVNTFIHEELDKIDRLGDSVRYGTYHEVHDLLQLSSAYEMLAIRLLDLGRMEDAFIQFSQAALCCPASWNNWEDTEWGEMLCKPLRGRFFAMYCTCKDLVRAYPRLRYCWAKSGLQEACKEITHRDALIKAEIESTNGNIREDRAYSRALQFGKDEVYRRRRA
jgi:hypothetical protein